MQIYLDRDQVLDILDEWCKGEHGRGISVSVWEVEDDKEFQGISIRV